jgi:signal transduction histidine kinase
MPGYEEHDKMDYLTISQIAHEIRNPLTYVDSSIQWIQKLHPEVETCEFWDQMKNDLHYIQLLLDDISTFNNGDQLNICRIDPREFAWDLKDTLLSELLSRHIPLLIKLDDTYPDFYGDPVRLKQAFLNILKNAMESITDRGRITLKVFAYEKKLMIAVKDNGCGIPADQLQDVFQPFVSFKEQGTGLGLSIAHKIVTAHHGTIHLKSTEGKGTEFQVYLPLRPADFQP